MIHRSPEHQAMWRNTWFGGFCVVIFIYQGQGHPCVETTSNNKNINGTKINCHGLHLHHIPRDLPRDTVWLDFSNNYLYNLSNYMFHHLPSLRYLDLTTCHISRLEEKAFEGLTNLNRLMLANNDLSLDQKTYPANIFLPLANLTYLDMGGNDMETDGEIPDNVFMNLPNLQTLHIDTFQGESFGAGFSVLTQIESLVLSQARWTRRSVDFCSIGYLYNDTFLAFENSSIRVLDMESCFLMTIDAGAYLPLQFISEIILTDVRRTYFSISVESLHKSLYGLNGKNITRLQFNKMHLGYRSNDNIKQQNEVDAYKYVNDICVEYLDLSENYLMLVSLPFLNKFSRCIKHLDLSRNALSSELMYVLKLFQNSNLEYLDISHQQEPCIKTTVMGSHEIMSADITIKLPPKLHTFNISSLSINAHSFWVVMVFDIAVSAPALTNLDLSFNGVGNMAKHIKGTENITHLDISGNDGRGISGDFITSFPNVKELTMKGINPEQLVLVKGSSFYKGIKSLKHLEIITFDNNNIQYLGHDIFSDMVNLTSISLAKNNFEAFPIDVSCESELVYLDLSWNSITNLTTETTYILDGLAQRHKFTLKLKENRLSCSCHTLYFIQWLFTTSVTLDEDGIYNCITDDGVLTTTLEVYQQWNYHWTGCQGRFWLPIAVILICLLLIVILISVLLVKNWTRVQHRLLVILGRGVQRVTRKDFKNDAYIAHSEEDGRLVMVNVREGLERFRLRLILPDRDFLPGQFVADNVVESVNNSWKTVLIVTDSFLDDPWSYFIMRTVSYSVSYPNSNRVILLMIGDVNRGRLPESLLNVTEEEDILETDEFPGPDRDIWTEIRDRVLSEAV